jgi:hypothetical protein
LRGWYKAVREAPILPLATKEVHDRFANPVGLSLHGNGRVSEGSELRRDGRHAHLRQIRAPEQRNLRVEGVAKDVRLALSAKARDWTLVTERLKDSLQAPQNSRGGLLRAFGPVGGRGEQLIAEEFLAVADVNAGPFARTKSWVAPPSFSPSGSLDADDLERRCARRGNGIIQNVARRG